MAAKKYYAVKKGKSTGIFYHWSECKAAVDGYSGAQYKGFMTLEEAQDYLKAAGQGFAEAAEAEGQKEKTVGNTNRCVTDESAASTEREDLLEVPPEGELLAYVDGSHKNDLEKYSFGCVFILPDGRIFTEYGNGNHPLSLQQRNVSGEMLGAMFAVKVAMLNGFQSLEIRYDYQGIENWVTGEWRAKTELTQKYAAAMQEWGKKIQIHFTKVAAHTNVTYNELADRMAKKGLTQGNGIPKVRKIEEMEEYCEE